MTIAFKPLSLVWRALALLRSGFPSVDAGRRGGLRFREDAGGYMDVDEAFRNATVWACVQYLTRAVAQLPWRVYQEDETGGTKLRPTNPADYVLHVRPCPDLGPFSWRQTMLGWALVHGNAYAEIEWDARGAVYALWPIHPDRVTVRRAEDGGLEYVVWNRSGYTVLSAADVFHVRGFGDGAVGASVIDYAAQSIGWARATEVFGSSFFKRGINPTMVLEVPQGLSPEAREMLLEDFEALYGGVKGRRTMVVDAGMKAQRISINPDEAQFVETRQHQVEEICRWFGVPPHKVMHLLRATFSNIEHQSIEVVVDSITPWVKIFEEEANYKLFGPVNRMGLKTKMNMRGLLRGDHASRAAYYKTMFELGVSVNDILGFEDMNGIGPDGDVRFVSNNVQTLERAIHGDPAPASAAETPAAGGGPNAMPTTNGGV